MGVFVRHSPDCQGQACEVLRLQGHQDQDCRWPDQGQAHEEQGWQDRVQGSVCSRQEEVCQGIGLWNKAVMTARKELGIKGFQAVGGKSAQGKALYAKAKSLYIA